MGDTGPGARTSPGGGNEESWWGFALQPLLPREQCAGPARCVSRDRVTLKERRWVSVYARWRHQFDRLSPTLRLSFICSACREDWSSVQEEAQPRTTLTAVQHLPGQSQWRKTFARATER